MGEYSVTVTVAVRATTPQAAETAVVETLNSGEYDDWDAPEPQTVIYNVTDIAVEPIRIGG